MQYCNYANYDNNDFTVHIEEIISLRREDHSHFKGDV